MKIWSELLTWREQEILELLSERLSDHEIATRLSISIHSVKWHNQQIYNKLGAGNRREAVALWKQGRQVSAASPDIAPGPNRIQAESPPAPAPLVEAPLPGLSGRRHNLPAELTSFIGREGEIRQLVGQVSSGCCRLVTLTGSGGTGKTRLALQVGSRVLDRFQDGVWLVELAPLGDPALVPSTVAEVLGLREVPGLPIVDALLSFLKNKHMLLILDNCEHVLPDCAVMIDSLLKHCPGLFVLATSREILNNQGEVHFRVPSLTAPDPEKMPPFDQLAGFEAIRLFLERAAQVSPGFELDGANAKAVATICHRLDGIPLAIELAAARMRVLPLAQITARLDNTFQLLMGGARTVMPRQQTLRATIDWSYSLLSGQERQFLQRLSIFSGGWTLEAAEAVCAEDGAEIDGVLDLLASLVEKSLVFLTPTPAGNGRYHMLQTIRQYGRERLLEAGGEEVMRERHLEYYMRFAEEIEPRLRGADQVTCLEILEIEIDNLRLALQWALRGQVTAGLRLASALKWFWHIFCKHKEGCQWLEKLLWIEAEQRGDQPLTVGVHSERHLLAWVRSINTLWLLYSFWFDHDQPTSMLTPEQIREMLAENLRLCREMGSAASRELVWALSTRTQTYAHFYEGTSAAFLEEALKISREYGYRCEEAHVLGFYWMEYYRMGEFLKGKDYLEQSLAIFRETQDADGMAWTLCESGLLATLLGEPDRARALVDEGLAYFEKVRNLRSIHGYNAYHLTIFPEPEAIRRAEQALSYVIGTQDTMQVIFVYSNLAYAEWSNGSPDRAMRQLEEAASTGLIKAISQHGGVWPIYLASGRVALSQGERVKARQFFQLAVADFQKKPPSEKGPAAFYLELLDSLSVLYTTQGDPSRAVTIFGAVEDLYQNYRLQILFPRQRSEHEEALRMAREVVTVAAFNAAWELGRGMALDQAVEFAMAGLEEGAVGPV